MNADVRIDIGVSAPTRHNDLWRETTVANEAFHWSTDLDNYLTVIPDVATNIFAYVESLRSQGVEPETHVSVRLSNPTHPTPATGVVPLPKGHVDLHLTNQDLDSSDTLQEVLSNQIANMRTVARY